MVPFHLEAMMAGDIRNDPADDAPTTGWPFAGTPTAELETIRKDHLEAESSIKALGAMALIFAAGTALLAVLGAVLLLASMARIELVPAVPGFGEVDIWETSVSIGTQGVLAILLWRVGIGMRRLSPWARNVYSAIIVVGTASALVEAVHTGGGTASLLAGMQVLLGIVFLAILWNPSSRVVLSEHYRSMVIPSTTHVAHEVSRGWALVAIVVGTFVVGTFVATGLLLMLLV